MDFTTSQTQDLLHLRRLFYGRLGQLRRERQTLLDRMPDVGAVPQHTRSQTVNPSFRHARYVLSQMPLPCLSTHLGCDQQMCPSWSALPQGQLCFYLFVFEHRLYVRMAAADASADAAYSSVSPNLPAVSMSMLIVWLCHCMMQACCIVCCAGMTQCNSMDNQRLNMPACFTLCPCYA